MKITLASSRSGSGLIIALMLTAIVGVNLASYLTLVRAQNRANMRSLAWNQALAVAESGVEEAMAHINRNGPNVNSTNATMAQFGWVSSGGQFRVSRTNVDTRYDVSISSNMAAPTILSTGYVSLVALQMPTSWVRRAVRIRTTNDALLVKSLVAKFEIDLKGNNVLSDSYDSTNPLFSTNGLYIASRARDNGDMASNSSLIDSIRGGNATVYGRVATGPGGSVSLGPSGAVGTRAWINAGNYGIQPGRYSDDMNVAFPDVAAPFSSAAAPEYNRNYKGTNWTVYMTGGNYLATSISVSGNQSIMVRGDTTLYVTGDFSMSGQSFLIIEPGASLKLYLGGNASLTGQGIYNQSGSALKCQFYALPTCTDWKMSGSPNFTGFLYAPSADFTSTGNSIYYGSVVCRTAKFTGNAEFHYDEALGRIGPTRGPVPIDWTEL